MTTYVKGQQSPTSKVFINYYEKDGSYANRIYLDLRAASLARLKKGFKIHEELDSRVGMAKNYTNIGNVLYCMGSYRHKNVEVRIIL